MKNNASFIIDAYFSKTVITAGGIIKIGAGSSIRVIAVWVKACNKQDKVNLNIKMSGENKCMNRIAQMYIFKKCKILKLWIFYVTL